MSKRLIIKVLVTAAAAALAVGLGLANGSASASATKTRVVPIVMKDPGCHWFHVNGKNVKRLAVHGAIALRNLDEAAVTFKSTGYFKRVAVGKTLTVTKAGTYKIKMVHQHPDDNTLVLVVK